MNPKFEKESKIRIDIPVKKEEYLYLLKVKGNKSWRQFILELAKLYEEMQNNKEKAHEVIAQA
uniref:Copy number regulation protein n=1 Tax=Sulfolobus neozealandicus TaxID=299422 RepID=Q5DVF2_9CREN|nr:copy number regulation protein [Sulfolobus neozealandicus]